MATEVMMPQLGESIVEGTIGRWLKKEGDWVEKYEPLVEIITDKVNAELPSPVAGVLHKILSPEGTTVSAGQVIATIEETAVRVPGEGVTPRSEEMVGAEERRYSPLVRKLAQEHGADLSQVRGTGTGGRVTKDDVLRYIEQKATRPAAMPTAKAPLPPAAPAPPPEAPPLEIITPSPIRKTIAERMVKSVQTAPHAWIMMEADVTPLAKWRESILEEFQKKEGFELTYLPFMVKAVADALKEHPIMNSTWSDDKIILKKEINIAIAVATEDGLIVPVIHHADEKNIAGLAKAIRDLALRSRAGKLTLADVQRGTFTVNNTGALGSIISVPIISPPQAAIITMEAVVKRPVVTTEDAIAIRYIANLCLSFDHRILDGAIAGRFLLSVKKRLESFGSGTAIY